MTYQEAYQKATGELKVAGIPEPESDSWILLGACDRHDKDQILCGWF